MDDINAPASDVFAAARTRRSIRSYKPHPVPPPILREVVELGRWAPSGTNTQPWNVHVLTGDSLRRLTAALQNSFQNDEPEKRDYVYYTDPLEEPYLARRRECGWGLYGTLGIARGEREKSKAYRATNFSFFGAPAGLVFTIERRLEIGSWLDYGMFLQTLMLAARARGLHTTPQASIANYPDLVRHELGLGSDWLVICGMAMGYADADAMVNTFQPPRLDVAEYAVFLD
jgi:nitroreductase